MQLAEIDKAVGDQAVLRFHHRLGDAMDRGDLGQHPGFGDFGVDPDLHQIGGDRLAQALNAASRFIAMRSRERGSLIANSWPSRPSGVRLRMRSAERITSSTSLVIRMQVFIGIKDRQNLIGEIGAGQGIQRGQGFVEQQQIG